MASSPDRALSAGGEISDAVPSGLVASAPGRVSESPQEPAARPEHLLAPSRAEAAVPAPGSLAAGSSATASLGQRFAAYLIDVVVLGACAFGIQILTFVVSAAATAVSDSLGQVVTLLMMLTLAAAMVWFAASMFVAVGRLGQTPGKRTIGIQILDADDGGMIGVGRAVKRQLVLVLMLMPCYLGLITYFSDSSGRNRAWHDKAVNDVVVQTTPVPLAQAVTDVFTILRRRS